MLFLLSSCAEKHPSNSINREEAEKEISENEFSESYETIIDIKNYNEEIKIEIPEYLKDKNKKYE